MTPKLTSSQVRDGLQSALDVHASSRPFPGVPAGFAKSGVKHFPSTPHTSLSVLGQRVLGVVHDALTPPTLPHRPNTQTGLLGAHWVNSFPSVTAPETSRVPQKEPAGAVAGPVHVDPWHVVPGRQDLKAEPQSPPAGVG
jgi:hypothetical protein